MDGKGVVVRRPVGFALPVVSGEVQAVDPEDGKWKPVVVAEERDGFVVKDKRKVK